MRWSLRIARVAGIDVRIHLTFLLLLAFVAYASYASQPGEPGGWPAVRFNLAVVLTLFGCVLLHEFGHALAARRYGIQTPDITLLPIGGVARMQRMPDHPWEEVVVALAGPLVNVVIAAGLIVGLGATVPWQDFFGLNRADVGYIDAIARLNVMLVVFNLVPAFPMDGGRVLRALLATRLRYGRATQIAATIGQGLCIAFALYAALFSHNVLHLLVAFFIYVAGSQEADAAKLKDAATGLRVEDAMITEFATLPENAVLDDAVTLLLRTSQHEFPVVDALGAFTGVLTRDDLIAALKKHGTDAPVAQFLRRPVSRVHPLDPFDAAFRAMQESACPALPVVDSTGRLIGLITPENVGELMLVHSLRLQNRAPAWRARPPAAPLT